MSSPRSLEALQTPLRRLQIIILALAGGSLAWCLVVFVLRQARAEQFGEGTGLLTLIASGYAVLSALTSGLVLRAAAASGCRRIAGRTYDQGRSSAATGFARLIEETGDEGRLFALLQTVRILGAAILEGAALFSGMAYLLEGRLMLLGIALLLSLSILFLLPTRGGLQLWIERGEERIRQLRGGGAAP